MLSYLLVQAPLRSLLPLLAAACLAAPLGAKGNRYAPEQLDQMVGPIALYPDPLVALILPAAANPADIAAAAQYLSSGGDPAQVDSQPWDPSVKGLAHYPDVLNWMSRNMDWTQALGAAFAMQPADVMKSVQQMRARARAAGTLVDTPQQKVQDEGDDILIVPAQDNTIYVPQYDADDVYDVPEGDDGPYLTFDAGYPAGPWLGFECDWDDFGIWVGPWHPGWAYRRDWLGGGYGRWHPDPTRGRALVRNYYHPGGSVPAPQVIAGARVPSSPGRGVPPSSRGSVTITHSVPDYRGYAEPAPGPRSPAPRPESPAPASPLFGGYNRGTQVRANSVRGHTSRQAPVRAAPARSAPSSSRKEPH
jgi:Protein of unknown function (DUF3300)